MKVLHVIPAVAKRHGGPTQAIFGMCQALGREGIESLIATTDADGPGRLPVPLKRPIEYQGVSVIFFPRQWSEAFKYSHPLAQWLDREVGNFDVVDIHAVFSHSSLAASRACLKRGVSYMVRPLGSLDPWSLKQKRFQKRTLWALGVGRMLECAKAIHYTTLEEKRIAEETLGLDRGIVIPLGVDEELFHQVQVAKRFQEFFPDLSSHPYLLVLSRLHPKKGLEYLLKAFLELTQRENFRSWRLVVAGDGEKPYVEKLKRLAQIRGENGKVIFPGWLDGARKAAALRDASLFVLPSYQENFGLSVAEAMSARVPVLVSRGVNLAPEIEKGGAGWVVELTAASLRESLEEALESETERKKRGRSGFELVNQRFRWPLVARELIQRYQEIIDS